MKDNTDGMWKWKVTHAKWPNPPQFIRERFGPVWDTFQVRPGSI